MFGTGPSCFTVFFFEDDDFFPSNASWLSPGRSTRSVACCIEFRKTPKSQTTPKETRNNTKTKQTKQNTPETSNVESDRRSSSETNDEGEVIALYQLRYWYGRKQDKRENRKHKKHIAIPMMKSGTNFFAGSC
jgi:hypothetical protein